MEGIFINIFIVVFGWSLWLHGYFTGKKELKKKKRIPKDLELG